MTTLYRFYDEADQPLYIGIAGVPHIRWEEHRARQDWWRNATRVTLEHFNSRKDALAAESEAIRMERPRYNRTHVPDVKLSAKRQCPPPYTARRIVQEIQDGIISGEFPITARLPSVAEMRRIYGVSSGTIRSVRLILHTGNWIYGDHTAVRVRAKRSMSEPDENGIRYLLPDGVDPNSVRSRDGGPDHPG